MALFAVEIPEDGRVCSITKGFQAEGGAALLYFRISLPRIGESCQIALNVSHENRYANGTEALRHDSQGHGFACPGCAGDETVAIRHGWKERVIFSALRNRQLLRHMTSDLAQAIFAE